MRRWILKGNNVYCPCCKQSFATFLPAGKPIRLNASCPFCGTVERHRLIWLFLEQNPEKLLQVKLLHIAPEPPFFDSFKNRRDIHYFPADKFMKGHKYPSGTKHVDVMSINYPDNYFNAVICNHVLEHVSNDKQAMKEFFRVLKPGSWAILQVPIAYTNAETFEDSNITTPEDREKYYGQNDHLRLFGRDYPERLREAGFDVDCIDFVNAFSMEDRLRYGLDEKDGIIYLCKKN